MLGSDCHSSMWTDNYGKYTKFWWFPIKIIGEVQCTIVKKWKMTIFP